jgi:hypothetical protein
MPLGTTTVTCSATDAHGNTRTESVSINVVDTNGPFVFTPGSMTVQTTSPSGTSVSFTATANDAVDGPRPVSCNPPSGSNFPLGSTQVMCTATDTRGNSGSGSLQVNVVPAPPAVTIVTPSSETLLLGNFEVVLETQSAVALQLVLINGSPAAFMSTTVTGASRWRRVVPGGSGTLTIHASAIDVAGRMGSATQIIDNDGIAAAIDSNPNAYSSDFDHGATSGRIVRSGGAHVTAVPNGGGVAIAQVSSGRAEIHACPGATKYVVLDAPGDAADITCAGPTVTVRATGAPGSIVHVLKQAITTRYVTYTQCTYVSGGFLRRGYRRCWPVTFPVSYTYWYSIPLAPGQSVSTGSPVTASADNTAPIEVTLLQMADDGSDIPVATLKLDPGESADVSVTPMPSREDVVEIAAVVGSIDAEVGGIPQTIAEGTTARRGLDLTPPVLTVPADVTAYQNADAGGVVVFSATAQDAVDGPIAVTCSPGSGSLFAIGTTLVTCSATDAQGNPAQASFTVTVLSTVDTLQLALVAVEDFQQAQQLLSNVLKSVDRDNVEAACGQLEAFINMVSAEAGKKLTGEEAELLIRMASDARAALGCQ